MKNYLSILLMFLSLQSFSQSDWTTEKNSKYSISYPQSWNKGETENPDDILLSGQIDEKMKDNNGYVGTTLLLNITPSELSTIDLVADAYKKKLFGTEFLKKTKIIREEKITFNGENAVDIIFTAKVEKYSTACRIILFQHNDMYYELSVTYDKELSKKLMDEAFMVMESFKFIQ